MKKINYCTFIIICFLAFCRNSNAQETSFGVEKEYQQIKIDGSQTFKIEDDGVWRAYYETGELLSEVLFKKVFNIRRFQFSLVMNGCRISYHRSGEISSVSEFKRGKLIRIAYTNSPN